MGNTLLNANVWYTGNVVSKSRLLLSLLIFHFYYFSFFSLTFSNIVNTLKITNHKKHLIIFKTTSNYSLQLPNEYCKLKHAKRFKNTHHSHSKGKSIERRNSLAVILHSLNPRTESIRNPVKDLRKGFAKIFNGFEPLTDFAESLVLDA